MLTSKTPDPVDVAVGENVRKYRKAMRISQQDLATSIGVTFQQVQKYERGVNRISSSMLVRISHTLGVTISDLFSGATKTMKNGPDPQQHAMNTTKAGRTVLDLWPKLTGTQHEAVAKLLEATYGG